LDTSKSGIGSPKTGSSDSQIPNEPRTYLVFDGNIRFPQDVINGQVHSERMFRVNEELFFNYLFKAAGPNPIQVYFNSALVYLRGDDSYGTQRRVIEDFKARMRNTQRVLRPEIAKNYRTMREGDGGAFNSVFAFTGEQNRSLGQHYRLTQKDLDSIANRSLVTFVLIEIPYKDAGKWHYLRTCQYPVHGPVNDNPGIWKFCYYFTDSD
jgi:hypothetical protein